MLVKLKYWVNLLLVKKFFLLDGFHYNIIGALPSTGIIYLLWQDMLSSSDSHPIMTCVCKLDGLVPSRNTRTRPRVSSCPTLVIILSMLAGSKKLYCLGESAFLFVSLYKMPVSNCWQLDRLWILCNICKLTDFTSTLFPGRNPILFLSYWGARRISHKAGNTSGFHGVAQEHVQGRCNS